jgi:pimeloyl-ACP methyl ester carboxylesterase
MINRLLLTLFALSSFGDASALTCGLMFKAKATSTTAISSVNFIKSVRYLSHKDLKIPFVDLMPLGEPNGRTVFLAAGFSKGMRSWLPHMRLLTKQGYRVISFDQTNIGYNLLENGIQKLDRNTGLDVDAELAMAVLKKSGVSSDVTILGHSRGSGVAARLALLASKKSIGVDKLLLLTPYVRYLWESANAAEAFGESVYDLWSEIYPQTYGKFLYEKSKVKKYEIIEELSQYDVEAALVYVLKGLKLTNKAEVTTADVLGAVLRKNKKIEITAFAAEQDSKLAPPSVVKELEQDGVNYSLFTGKNKDHYWPLHYAESMLKAVDLL